MEEFFARLKEHKLVQWTLAYIAVSFALLPVLDIVAERFGWSQTAERCLIIAIGTGFFVMLVIAWYHGERGVQRVTRSEHAILAVLVVLGGLTMWRLGPVATKPAEAKPAATMSWTAVPAPPASASAPIPPKSIAVLPFENLSADKDNVYFADGMQDLILTKLADIGDLKVISRTSTAKYASHPDDLKTIAQQLGVATILEGSVQKAGKQVLINVQLIDARTDSHLWAEAYTRTLDNICGVEGEVAQKIAEALKATLTPRETAVVTALLTQDSVALDDYLRGEHYFTRTLAGDWTQALPKAVEAYQKAVDQDPQFALAWARLAMAQSWLMYADIDSSDATRQKALANARHALALAPDLPQAHLALGYVYRMDFSDYRKALAEFKLARQALPNNAEVEAAIAYVEHFLGNPQAVLTGLQRAVALDPRNPNLALSLGMAYESVRQYDRGLTAYQRALAVAPDDPEIYANMAYATLSGRGDVDAALAELAQAPPALQSRPEIAFVRARFLLFRRDYAAARRAASSLQVGGRMIPASNVALLRGDISRLAGDTGAAHGFYTQVLDLVHAQRGAYFGEAGWRLSLNVALAEAELGNRAAAMQSVDEQIARANHAGSLMALLQVQVVLAQIDAQFGDAGQAVALLDKLMVAPIGGELSLPRLKLDPAWDPIRNDPRFQALLKKYEDDAPGQSAAGGKAVVHG